MSLIPPASFKVDEVSLEMTQINGWSKSDAAELELAGIEVNRREYGRRSPTRTGKVVQLRWLTRVASSNKHSLTLS